MMNALDYLRDLVALTGPSGSEEDVIRAIAHRVRPLVDSLELDPMGNLIATRTAKEADARSCVIAVHMDEIGFRIRKIEHDGFLRFEKVGGSDDRVLLGQRVWVRGDHGRLVGVIGTKSAHLLRESDRVSVPPHTTQYIDIGARSDGHAREMGVRVGTPVGFTGDLMELGLNSGRFTAHALDDRVGCAVLLALLDRLQEEPVPVTVVGLFTVQEEVGLRGVQAAAVKRLADVGLAIDTTAVDDTPDTGTCHLRLGAGPAVKVMDIRLLAHPAVRRTLDAAAKNAGIAVQQEILMGIGTDAAALQFSAAGTPAGTLSLGTRYTHSPIEVLDRQELEDSVTVLHHFLQALPETDLAFTSFE